MSSKDPATMTEEGTASVSLSRRRSRRRRAVITTILIAVAIFLAIADVCLGHEVYSLSDVWSVISGSGSGGAQFSIGEIRLPRALVALFCGAGFGIAGTSFQTLLGNVLASPDIIGVTAGANLAAVLAITVLGLSGLALFGVAVAGGLATACCVLLLSWSRGFASSSSPTSRFILVGIGIAAMLNAATSWLMVRADQWDVQAASRWLTGSLTDVGWSDVIPAVACVVGGYLALTVVGKSLDILRFGTPMATGLGVKVNSARAGIIVISVMILSVMTATTGPIAFVSFLAGPIAVRLLGSQKPALLSGAAVGAIIVLLADIVAQHLPSGKVPVGVMTSLVGGPLLVFLVARMMRKAE